MMGARERLTAGWMVVGAGAPLVFRARFYIGLVWSAAVYLGPALSRGRWGTRKDKMELSRITLVFVVSLSESISER